MSNNRYANAGPKPAKPGVLAVMKDAEGPIAWQLERAIERYEADCEAGYGASLIDRSREAKDRAAERCQQLIEARATVERLAEAAEEALTALGCADVQIEGEWGDGRNFDELEAEGDLSDEYMRLRAALAAFRGEA